MFFVIDLVSRWFARLDHGFAHGFDLDLDPLASPDDRSAQSWLWAPAPTSDRVA
jgi:hypothetical protein